MREYVLFVMAMVWDILGTRARHQINSKEPPLGYLKLRTVRTTGLRTCMAFDFAGQQKCEILLPSFATQALTFYHDPQQQL